MNNNLKIKLINAIQGLEISENNKGTKIIINFKAKSQNLIFDKFSFFIKKINIMGIETFILGECDCTIHSTYCLNDHNESCEEIAMEIIKELEKIEENCESEIFGFSR